MRGLPRSVAGEVTSITNNTYQNAPYNPETLASNVVNGPFGPVSYTLGNGLNVYRSYDQLGRPAGMWVCNGAAGGELQWRHAGLRYIQHLERV